MPPDERTPSVYVIAKPVNDFSDYFVLVLRIFPVQSKSQATEAYRWRLERSGEIIASRNSSRCRPPVHLWRDTWAAENSGVGQARRAWATSRPESGAGELQEEFRRLQGNTFYDTIDKAGRKMLP